ncbi:Gp49 family protein, partial [Dysosmobacter welbionis]
HFFRRFLLQRPLLILVGKAGLGGKPVLLVIVGDKAPGMSRFQRRGKEAVIVRAASASGTAGPASAAGASAAGLRRQLPLIGRLQRLDILVRVSGGAHQVRTGASAGRQDSIHLRPCQVGFLRLVLLVQVHPVHPAVVIHAVLPLKGGQLVLKDVEVGEILVEGEVPVRVELSQLVQVLGIVQLLLRVDRIQILQAHVVLVQVAVVCLLVQRGDDVVQLGRVVVPGLGGRSDGRRGGAPAAGGRRLAKCVCGGP